jgi:uncharacterized membrane protein YhaH (DUF805 family)
MKWVRFFTNFDGRITRKTFWLASIAVLVIELLIAAAAAATAEEFADEATGDLATDIVLFAFLYPQFAISVKRGHDRNISTWVIAHGMWCSQCPTYSVSLGGYSQAPIKTYSRPQI